MLTAYFIEMAIFCFGFYFKRWLTLAFLIRKGARHLSLAEDVQQSLLGLAGGLGQGKALRDGGHEAALHHVQDQHHLGCVARIA